MKHEALQADGGQMDRLQRFLAAAILRAIDAAIAFLQDSRNRIEAPPDEETARRGRRNIQPAAAAATPPSAGKPEPRRLRRFLVVTLALVLGGVTGMAYSYKLLARSINSKETVIEYLRDEITQLEKQGARSVNEMARYRKKIDENEKELLAYAEEIQDYKKQAEELRSRLSSLQDGRRNPPVGDGYGAVAARSRQPAPEKTGTCTMGATNAAANVSRCVEEFNRK